jgi:ADP-ribose pyrophosphatase YjhB (NUDIX family)
MQRDYPERPITAVGVVVRRGDRLLHVRRGQAPSYGEWSLPGGAIELGERATDAARREIREECGLDIDIVKVLDVVDRIVRDAASRIQYHYVIIEFLADYRGGELRASSDSLEARWVSRSESEVYHLRPEAEALVRRGLAE